MLAGFAFVPTNVEAAAEYYNTYNDVSNVSNYNSCTAMQGLAVGSQYMYTVKIDGNDSQAVIFRTDKDTKETVKLRNADSSSYYFTYLGHANDMEVHGFDGKSHLFIATMTKGNNAVVRLKRSGTDLNKVASYSLTYNGSSASASGISIMSVADGMINFIFKSGSNIYTGSIS